MRRLVPLLAALSLASVASAQLLYDGSLDTTPDAQDWYYLTEPIIGASATQSAGGGVTTLDTMPDIDDHAGYFNKVPPFLPLVLPVPPLDRSTGFRLTWTVRVDDEDHGTRVDRAGLSVIVLAEDALGLEIGHWRDEVWVQEVGFTHAEGFFIDTTARLTTYDVCIEGDEYTLSVEGAPMLTGAVRDYSGFGAPYDIPSFLFIGDDTTSARARFELSRVEIATGPCTAASCASTSPPVARVQAVRSGDDVELSWDPATGAGGYNVWFVDRKEDIDSARIDMQPPAQPVPMCAAPMPVPVAACTDVDAMTRAGDRTFYQVRVYCDDVSEGP